MGDEIELKLDPAPDAAADAASLFAHEALAGGPVTTLDLRTVYFDTPDQRLGAAGFSLRIRDDRQRRIQTVKAGEGAAAGLFVRPEWECEAPDGAPRIDDRTPLPALLGSDASLLAPLLELRVRRFLRTLVRDGSTVEMLFDQGEVLAAGRSAPLCEIELELKEGEPAALFAVARQIDAVAPVRLGVRTKSDRGLALRGPAQLSAGWVPARLEAGISAAAAFQANARATLRHYRLNETIYLETKSSEALHQARVALRRLRTLLGIHADMLADAEFALLTDGLRLLAADLGAARDIDVLLAATPAGPLHEALARAAAEAHEATVAMLAGPRARHLILDIGAWLVCGNWLHDPLTDDLRREAARLSAARTFDRLRRQVRRRGENLVDLSDEVRHALRKTTKRLRYAIDFHASLFDGRRERQRRKRFSAVLARLQDRLGTLNDAAVAPAIIARLGLGSLAPADARQVPRGKLLRQAAAARDELLDLKRFWR